MKRYTNFDLELTDYTGGNGAVEAFWVRVVESLAGGQRRSEAVRVELTGGLRESFGRLERRELDLAGLFSVGKSIGDLMLPPPVRSFWKSSVDKLADDEGLRVRLKLDTWALADVPWEYAWLPVGETTAASTDASGFLALDRRVSIVRYEILGLPVGRLDPIGEGPLRLVAVMVSPESPDLPRLELEREAAALKRALEEHPEVHLELLTGGTLPELERTVEHGAHMFHFAGHGRFDAAMAQRAGSVEGRGFLVFRDAAGKPDEVAADKLVVNLRGRGVRLAVLGACLGARRDLGNPWQGIAPALVRAGLPAVVAMQATVRDDSAVVFSARCYEMLAAGAAIDAAVTAGRIAIFNRGIDAERDWGVPVLYLRSDSGVLFPREADADGQAPLGRRGWANVALSGAAAILLLAGYYLFAQPRVPDRWLLGGGLSVVAVLGGTFAWLLWLAGHDVRAWVRRLLPRRRVTVGLAAGAVALLGVDIGLHKTRPVVVRVIPGIRLTTRLPEPGPSAADPFTYTLRVWQGTQGDGPDWVLSDLRTSGGALGTSEWIEQVVLERETGSVRERLRKHLSLSLQGQDYIDFGPKFLDLWSGSGRAHPTKPGARRRPAQPLRFELWKMKRGTSVPIESEPLEPKFEIDDGVEIVIVESKNG